MQRDCIAYSNADGLVCSQRNRIKGLDMPYGIGARLVGHGWRKFVNK